MANPQLGYNKPTEASIDQVNQWMRSQPWYQDQLKAWGQNPWNTHLSKGQSQQILRMAQQQGVVVDEGNMEVDSSGNFNPKGHKLRNTLIVAGIAGAAIATMGAAGVFAGAGGATTGAAGGAGAAAGGSTAAAGVTAGVGGMTASPALASTLSAGSMIGGGAGAGTAAAGTAAAGVTAGVGGMTASPALASTLSPGSMIGGGAGAGTAAASTGIGAGADALEGWGADGSFLGETSIPQEVSSRLPWNTLLKYGVAAGGDAIRDGLANSRSKAARNQATALAESQMDPFRGYMHQAGDLARLDAMANGNFDSTPVQLDAKYGAGLNVQPTTPYRPSAMTRSVLRSAMGGVASGTRVPTMTDPKNYGRMPMVNYAPPAGPSVDETEEERRRRLGLAGDSPWLAS